MEAMSLAGLPTVMFLEAPDEARLGRFAGYRAVGIASTARARSPAWMDSHLPAAFSALKALAAPLTHYKVCSTFDSAPTLGSIGRAIEHGAAAFAPRFVPLVTAAPANGRFQAFGNLFAAVDGAVHRLDRHPVMSRHPATPMHEADLARHLGEQTSLRCGLVDLAALKAGRGGAALEDALAAGAAIVSFDVVDDETLETVGAIVWGEAARGASFAAGSHGLEHALIAHWRAAGLLPPVTEPPEVAPTDRMVVVSGSVSPVTAAQIAHAEAHGFEVVALDAAAAVDERAWSAALDQAIAAASAALGSGRIPLVATARGPDDPAVVRFGEAVAARGLARADVAARIGTGLGRILRELVATSRLRRAILSGGDTSGYAVTELGVFALAAVSPLAPGAPLCRTFAEDPAVDGLEVCLKGGQIGGTGFFVACTGRPAGAA
ncbi:MAG: four-carbon acid sugar kinase family protein [Alphaproteobacteria bacterium]|nr:four-carbon acid sugar kinase family protein [Alphaproteobacteria bacterium]